MKKLFFAFVALSLLSMNISAQDGSGKVFCELLGTSKFMSTKIKVTVDFGQETSIWTGSAKQELVDENGEVKTFNSMVDAMNYMGSLGWDFEQAYVVSVGQQSVYHWLLSKNVSSREEFKEGIKTRKEFEQEQKVNENE